MGTGVTKGGDPSASGFCHSDQTPEQNLSGGKVFSSYGVGGCGQGSMGEGRVSWWKGKVRSLLFHGGQDGGAAGEAKGLGSRWSSEPCHTLGNHFLHLGATT